MSYFRGLANFADTGYYARDGRKGRIISAIFAVVGPHWAIYGGFIGADTSQTAVPEQLYNFHSKAGNAGIELAASSQNSVTLDYKYTDATFPQNFVLNGTLIRFAKETERVLGQICLQPATELSASAGCIWLMSYPQSNFATFSGDIWKAALQWTPTRQPAVGIDPAGSSSAAA